MTQDFLEYPKMVERAMRGVVRDALIIATEGGLPGLHHFYITFRTNDPGVSIGDRLLAQYPEEMTIVLEHQFWDLAVADDQFSVTLSFGGAPENLVIPFVAITAFVDPSVKFGLQFDTVSDDEDDTPENPDDASSGPAQEKAPGQVAQAASKSEADASTEEGQVVALDQFRKK